MKVTVEISNDLLVRAQERAVERGISLSALIEEGLAMSVDEPLQTRWVSPVTFKGNGLSCEFEGASWEKVREAIYR